MDVERNHSKNMIVHDSEGIGIRLTKKDLLIAKHNEKKYRGGKEIYKKYVENKLMSGNSTYRLARPPS